MWSNSWNYFAFSILLLLTDFREISLLLELEGRLFGVCGAPVTQNPKTNSTSYLRKYGYLPRSDFETHQWRSDSEKQEAIRRFQRMSRINQTGKMDDKTREAMQRPRCGLQDVPVSQEFRIGPSRWNKMQLTYRILSYTGDLNQYYVDQEISRGFQHWSSVTALNFQQIFYGEADLMIAFPTQSHGDGSAFDGAGVNLHIVASHEIGHALGLSHSEDQNSLMYPVYQGYVPNFKLSNDDIAGIQTIYGSKSHPKFTSFTPQYPVYRTSTTPRPRVRDDNDPPNLCRAKLEAVSSIRGQIFAFHKKWFWRIIRDDKDPAAVEKITSYWRGFPETLEHIDAVFESRSGRIFFFNGQRYWEFDANYLARGFPRSGKSIRELGLPSDVDRITAAFVWERTRKIYLFSDDRYWGLEDRDDPSKIGVAAEYPQGMDMWMGSPFPIDAAFTHFDGRTYFIQRLLVWRLEKDTMNVERESPQKTRTLWPQCDGVEDTDDYIDTDVSSILQSPAFALHATLVLLSRLLLSFYI